MMRIGPPPGPAESSDCRRICGIVGTVFLGIGAAFVIFAFLSVAIASPPG